MAADFTWLSVAALSSRLGRARSTIRLWRDQHRTWVPERRDAHGYQAYPLERMEEIAVLAAQRLTPREIGAELERRHGDAGEAPPPSRDDRVLELLEQIALDVRRIADHFDQRED